MTLPLSNWLILGVVVALIVAVYIVSRRRADQTDAASATHDEEPLRPSLIDKLTDDPVHSDIIFNKYHVDGLDDHH